MTVDLPPQGRRYWLLTMPRTASNMLVRVLNLDEQGVRPSHGGGYFFFPSMGKRLALYRKPMREWTPEERSAVEESVRTSFDALQDYLEAAEADGQRIFVKEHVSFFNEAFFEDKFAYGADGDDEEQAPEPIRARGFARATRSPLNKTSLPDEFLRTWHPTFLIRHPALMIPSLYRTAQRGIVLDGGGRSTTEPYAVEATLGFVRALHDFYAAHFGPGGHWPVVLDADDVIAQPDLVARYARLAGLDPDRLRFSWERAGEAQLGRLRPAEKVMLSSFNDSTGVDRDKMAGDLDVDVEAAKWRREFGDDGGRKVEEWVRAAMPDYEYLRSRRLTLG